jgi:hypothetical protein
MKSSTLWLLGGAAVAYYLYKNQGPLTGATTGSVTLSHGATPPIAAPAATSMLAATAPVDPSDPTNPPADDYSDVAVPSYSWAPPVWGARAWSGGGHHRRGRR